MIKYLLLGLLPLSLYASKILSYNIYERSDRADVMITFDTPYSGVIKQSKGTNKIIIKLQDASLESSKIKKVNSKYLHSLTITPLKGQTQILANISPNVRLIASKTADAYGLRLRFTSKTATKARAKVGLPSVVTDLSALPTKKDVGLSTSYYVVVGLLIAAIILLLMFKKKIIASREGKLKESWLFNANQTQEQTTTPTQQPAKTHATTDMVSIRFQKSIDNTNSVVMLDFGEESYLVLMGNSNILLDKFRDDKPTSQQEFESILQERNRELEDFLGASDEGASSYSSQSHKEPLQAYKERAASLIYSEEA